MRILVTGGAGYVGSHVTKFLIDAGQTVVVYDDLSQGHRAAVPADCLVVGSLADRPNLVRTMRSWRVEAVVHLASLALVGESMNAPARYYSNNVAGSLTLFEAMIEADVTKCLFSSTAAVYGAVANLPIKEDAPCQPVNPYGSSKLMVETILRSFSEAYGWAVGILRYFNAAGAHGSGKIGEDHRPESHLIPQVLQVALNLREKVLVFGGDYPTADGSCVRDYVHVDDLANAHARTLERLEPRQVLTLNLGGATGYSVRNVVDVCRRVTGCRIQECILPRRLGDPDTLVADAGRAGELLGWCPTYTDLESIVESAWRWHRARPHGYSS